MLRKIVITSIPMEYLSFYQGNCFFLKGWIILILSTVVLHPVVATYVSVYEAIFMFIPGLSTTNAPTDAAGRGMGMGIVRQTVKDLGGSLHFQFAHGQGCLFDIRIPIKP